MLDKDGAVVGARVVEKYMPPNLTMNIFWLKNRNGTAGATNWRKRLQNPARRGKRRFLRHFRRCLSDWM